MGEIRRMLRSVADAVGVKQASVQANEMNPAALAVNVMVAVFRTLSVDPGLDQNVRRTFLKKDGVSLVRIAILLDDGADEHQVIPEGSMVLVRYGARMHLKFDKRG